MQNLQPHDKFYKFCDNRLWYYNKIKMFDKKNVKFKKVIQIVLNIYSNFVFLFMLTSALYGYEWQPILTLWDMLI